MRLYHKLNAALVLTALFSAGLLSFIFFRFQKESILEAERDRLEMTRQGVQNILSEAGLAHDPLMLVDYLSSLYAYHPEISAIEALTGNDWQPVRPRGRKPAPRATAGQGPPDELHTGEFGARLYYARDYLLAERQKLIVALAKRLAYSLGAAACISALFALLLNYHLTKRLRILSKETEILGAGKFGHKIAIAGSDEIAQLAENFNRMSGSLLELETMKRDFTASVTHELRSPLGAIESHVAMLLRTPRPRAEEEGLERIKANAVRLSNFVTTLLDLAKIERGKMELHLTLADPCALASDIADFFAPKAGEKGIILETRAAAGRKIRLDRELLAHVFTNLLSNAIKFTPEGGKVVLDAGFRGDGAIFEARVTDHGPGVSPEDRKKLFTVFGQGKAGAAAKGTGLGLSLAKGIIDMHKGRLGFEPAAGGGAVFWFEIPADL